MSIFEKNISSITYIEAFLAVILAWVLIALWQRFIENFSFGYLGLDPKSSLHSFVVALSATLIFFSFTYFSDSDISSIIVGSTETISGPDSLIDINSRKAGRSIYRKGDYIRYFDDKKDFNEPNNINTNRTSENEQDRPNRRGRNNHRHGDSGAIDERNSRDGSRKYTDPRGRKGGRISESIVEKLLREHESTR